MRTRDRVAAAAFLLLVLPQVAAALPVISEFFYDATGSDDGKSFVELYGEPGTPLADYVLEGVNGSNGDITPRVVLTGGVIAADGVFVIADGLSDGTTTVLDADLILNFDFQNGPDSVQLLAPDGSILDALGYGVFAPGEFFAGEGNPAVDGPVDTSLARLFADVDTDDNAADFAVGAPTPGSAPVAVPEPASGALVCAGLAGIAGARRRRPQRT